MAEAWRIFFQPGEALLWEGVPRPGVHGRAKKSSDGDRSTARADFDTIAVGDNVSRLLRSIQMSTT